MCTYNKDQNELFSAEFLIDFLVVESSLICNYFSDKVKVDSWWRFLLHCSYCMCLCDAPGPQSDRYTYFQFHEKK